eukprot:UN27408
MTWSEYINKIFAFYDEDKDPCEQYDKYPQFVPQYCACDFMNNRDFYRVYPYGEMGFEIFLDDYPGMKEHKNLMLGFRNMLEERQFDIYEKEYLLENITWKIKFIARQDTEFFNLRPTMWRTIWR